MPNTFEALLCIALGIAPGYLFFAAMGAVSIREVRSSTSQIIESVTGSMVFWVVVGPILYWAMRGNTANWSLFIAAGLLSVIAPVVLGIVWGLLERSGTIRKRLGIRNPVPTSWDYRFGLRKELWVLVTLSDGSHIGGLWASNSFASSYPSATD